MSAAQPKVLSAGSNGHSHPPAPWYRRRRAMVAAGLVALLALYVVSVTAMLLRTRAEMERSRTELTGARQALVDLDFEAAAARLGQAERRLRRSEERLGNPLFWPLRRSPVVGEKLRAMRLASGTTSGMAAHATSILTTVEAFPGGLGDLAPRSGRLPLARYADLAPALSAASTSIALELSELAEGWDAPLLRQIEAAVTELMTEGQAAADGLRIAAAALEIVDELFGGHGARRYFFGAGNPAELRGNGGFLGAYALLTVHDGRLEFGAFHPIQSLENLPPDEVAAPNPDFARRYAQYGGAGFWQNINMTPDFPSAASAIERLYEETTGERVDGVMVADPFALQELAAVTGPVDIPELGRIQPDEIVEVLSNEAFGEFDDTETRKRTLGAVAASIFTRFLGGAGDPADSARALLAAAGNGHLLIHSADSDLQARLVEANLAGAMPAPDVDYLNVSGANGAGNKADFYTDRAVSYDVVLNGDASGLATAAVDLHNHTPRSGKPAHVIGPNYSDFEAGENATILNLLCGRCRVSRFEREGMATPVRADKELGHNVFWSYERLKSGESVDLSYRYLVPDAWRQGDYLGRYELIVDGQVTIRPTKFDVSVTLPEGAELVGTSPHMVQNGSVLRWEGEMRGGRQHFEVVFRPAGNPLWHSLTRWWNRPLLQRG